MARHTTPVAPFTVCLLGGRGPGLSCCPSPVTRVRAHLEAHRPSLSACPAARGRWSRRLQTVRHIQLLLPVLSSWPEPHPWVPVRTPARACRWPPSCAPIPHTAAVASRSHRLPQAVAFTKGQPTPLTEACGICPCPCPLPGLISWPTCSSHTGLSASPCTYQVHSHFGTFALLLHSPDLPQLPSSGTSSETTSLTTLPTATAPPFHPAPSLSPFFAFVALLPPDVVMNNI